MLKAEFEGDDWPMENLDSTIWIREADCLVTQHKERVGNEMYCIPLINMGIGCVFRNIDVAYRYNKN